MLVVPIISLTLLLIYAVVTLSGNTWLPKNQIAKRILLSMLIGFAIQLTAITTVPGAFVLFLIDNTLKSGVPFDWRILILNMLLYAGFSFLILTAWDSGKRTKKSI